MLQRLKRQLRVKNAAAGGKLQLREKKNCIRKNRAAGKNAAAAAAGDKIQQ